MSESELLERYLPPENEMEEEFVRTASGPGGQNVNKTATAVRLVFHFNTSEFLSETVKIRLSELTGTDFISILARESRSLPDNRSAARVRLAGLIAAASKVVKKRKKTKPTRASRERRLKSKAKHSELKAQRSFRGDS